VLLSALNRAESQIEEKKKRERYARENNERRLRVKAAATAIVVAKGEFLKVKWVTIAKSLSETRIKRVEQRGDQSRKVCVKVARFRAFSRGERNERNESRMTRAEWKKGSRARLRKKREKPSPPLQETKKGGIASRVSKGYYRVSAASNYQLDRSPLGEHEVYQETPSPSDSLSYTFRDARARARAVTASVSLGC